MHLQKPIPLKTGDVIGIVTPSTPASLSRPEKYQLSMDRLSQLGFRVQQGSLSSSNNHQGFRLGTPADRGKEFMELINDSKVSCILHTCGGLHANSIIPYLNFDQIASSKKLICGCGDFSSVLISIQKSSQLVTCYTPTLLSLLGQPGLDEQSWMSFMSLTSSFKAGSSIATPPSQNSPHRWTPLRSGKAHGHLVVAELESLLSLSGTKHWPILAGNILVIEIKDSAFSLLESSLSHLKLLGTFEIISGVVFSKPRNLQRMNAPFQFSDLVIEAIGTRNIPILMDFNFGHTNPALSLPSGTMAELYCEKDYAASLVLLEPAVGESE